MALLTTLWAGTGRAIDFGGGGFGGGGPAFDRAIGLGIIGPDAGGVEAAGPGGWTLTSGIALSATYSDNANLTSGSNESQDEVFLQVLPHFALEGEGARVKARGYFAPAVYTGTIGGSPARIAPFLDLRSTVELVPESFFVTGNAKASMVNQSAGGPGSAFTSNNYLYNSDEITPAFTLQISPYYRQHLGRTADFHARLTLGTTNFLDSSSNNSVNASMWAGLTSGAEFDRMPWSVNYNLRGLKFSDDSTTYGDSNTYQSLRGHASYVISPVWRIDTSLGYANYDYESASNNKSGPTWSLGGTWTPSARLALSLGYAGEPYGNSWYMNYRYAHKRVAWYARYFTGLTTVQQEFAESDTFVQRDPDGLPLVDPVTGLPILVTRIDPALTNESYVLSRFFTGINWTGVRTTIGFNASWSEREYQVSGNSERDWGLGARASRTLSPDLTADARLGWTKSEDQQAGAGGPAAVDGADEEDGWYAGFSLTKRLTQRSSVSGIYAYNSNLGAVGFGSSGSSGASGDENRVTLVFNHTF